MCYINHVLLLDEGNKLSYLILSYLISEKEKKKKKKKSGVIEKRGKGRIAGKHYSYIWTGKSADKKENKIFLLYREIQMGSGAKSYMRKGLLIYEEMHKNFHHMYMRRSLVIYGFASDPSEFPNI